MFISVPKEKKHHILVPDEQADAILKSNSHLHSTPIDVEHGIAKALAFDMVELSSEEDGNDINKSSTVSENHRFEDPKTPVWLCISPDGEKTGPYSLAFLKHLKECSPNSSAVKVLKTGQSEKSAIPLIDAVTLLL